MGLSSLLKNSVLRSIGSQLRQHCHFSTAPPEVPKYCYVMGCNGAIKFPGDCWESMADHVQKNPFIVPIPSGTLYGAIDPAKPFTVGPIRDLCGSGVLQIKICRDNGVSLKNPFTMDNVGVIKKLNLMAFKSLEPDPSNTWIHTLGAGYSELGSFLPKVVAQYHGGLQTLQMIPEEMHNYFCDLRSVQYEEFTVNHPFHLTDIQFADLIFEIYRLLRQESVVVGAGAYAEQDILEFIGKHHANAFSRSQAHRVMSQFYPTKIKKRIALIKQQTGSEPQSMSLSDLELGKFVVDSCRHCGVHTREPQVEKHVRKVLKNPLFTFTRGGMLGMLRHFYSDHPRRAVYAFIKYNQWHLLAPKERFPIPSIYKAPVFPTEDEVGVIPSSGSTCVLHYVRHHWFTANGKVFVVVLFMVV